MKRKIIKWLVNKLEKTTIKYVEIGEELKFNWTKNIPNNNDWQHVGLTFECWVKKNGDNEVEKYDVVKTYIDGKLDKQFDL